ncbi:MAG: hypothetical protein WC059_02080 [Candidatus Paceibacterota bacterium]
MGKRGPQPKKLIDLTWRPELAYAIGLIATDGCLGQDGLLVDLTSKDKEQLKNFSKCLGVDFKIGIKINTKKQEYFRIQFKNKIFYDFLFSLGLTPRKSLTVGELAIPKKYFFDFLRGCFDGDGSFYSYWDPRWKSSHLFYLSFGSASKNHILWIQEQIYLQTALKGHISKSRIKGSIYSLRYAKKDALVIIKKMYYNPKVICLSRKKLKIKKALKIEAKQQRKYI